MRISMIEKWQKEEREYSAIPRATVSRNYALRLRRDSVPELGFAETVQGCEDFVVLDTETTGLSPQHDRIVQLGAVRFRNGRPVEAYETLVNPQRHIDEGASAINNLTDDIVANAPKLAEVLEGFDAFVGEDPVVGHNLRFDLLFLHYSGSNILTVPRNCYDTWTFARSFLTAKKKSRDKFTRDIVVDLSVPYEVEDFRLASLCEYYGIMIVTQHAALADALGTGKLFLALQEDLRLRREKDKEK